MTNEYNDYNGLMIIWDKNNWLLSNCPWSLKIVPCSKSLTLNHAFVYGSSNGFENMSLWGCISLYGKYD